MRYFVILVCLAIVGCTGVVDTGSDENYDISLLEGVSVKERTSSGTVGPGNFYRIGDPRGYHFTIYEYNSTTDSKKAYEDQSTKWTPSAYDLPNGCFLQTRSIGSAMSAQSYYCLRKNLIIMIDGKMVQGYDEFTEQMVNQSIDIGKRTMKDIDEQLSTL